MFSLLSPLLIGLFGGGAIVQLLQLFVTRRQSARRTDADALGAEVQALENAINTLRRNLDAETERHEKTRARLEARISDLEAQISDLRAENLRLHSLQQPVQ